MSALAIQIVDLGFGDAGKGTFVDYLAREYRADLVVRFNGGPQAGHNVVLPDGRHHTFSQFGSATFVPGVRTLLSRFMAIEPYAMLNEARHLASLGVDDALGRTWIDARCPVITPLHQVGNRMRERSRGSGAHGTCGMGYGECVADQLNDPAGYLCAGDFLDQSILREKLGELLRRKRVELLPLREFALAEELKVLEDEAWIDVAMEMTAVVRSETHILPNGESNSLLAESRVAIFEGAQGVLLDEKHGFHPHTTWSKTAFENADLLLDEGNSSAERWRIGVMRTYMTRHGAGPFASHRAEFDALLPESHNDDRGWQGAFRRGVLDWSMLRYAIKVCGRVDGVAVSHMDRLGVLPGVAWDGEKEVGMPVEAECFLGEVEGRLGCRVEMTSEGATFREKVMRGESAMPKGTR